MCKYFTIFLILTFHLKDIEIFNERPRPKLRFSVNNIGYIISLLL